MFEKIHNRVQLSKEIKKRLENCYRQGNSIASTSYKLKIPYSEVEGYYCLQSLNKINEEFEKYHKEN